MKMTVSVPDDLWLEATEPGESPSAAIQDALRLRAGRSRSNPLADHPEILGDPQASARLDELVADVRRIREGGFRVGVDAGLTLGWEDLERQTEAGRGELTAEIRSWFRGDFHNRRLDQPEWLPQSFYETLSALVKDHETGGKDMDTVSPLLVETMAGGVQAARLAVLNLAAEGHEPDRHAREEA